MLVVDGVTLNEYWMSFLVQCYAPGANEKALTVKDPEIPG